MFSEQVLDSAHNVISWPYGL